MPVVAIVGATGTTGREVARVAPTLGLDTLLIGRNARALADLAARTRATGTRVVDLEQPHTLDAALDRCDVAISCVSPFGRWGLPVARAVVKAGADYVDTNGESVFLLDLDTELGQQCRAKSIRVVSAVGVSSLPADLATAFTLRDLGEVPIERIAIGYQVKGYKPSAGSMQSQIRIMSEGALHVAKRATLAWLAWHGCTAAAPWRWGPDGRSRRVHCFALLCRAGDRGLSGHSRPADRRRVEPGLDDGCTLCHCSSITLALIVRSAGFRPASRFTPCRTVAPRRSRRVARLLHPRARMGGF
jgi:hypothetical protein